MQPFSKFVTPIPLWIRMRIYVNVINKSETVPQHRQLYTISFSDTLPLTSTRSGTKLSLRLSARLSKYRHTPRLWEVFYAFHYSLASYTMLPSHIVIITLPFSLLPSHGLFDDLLLVFSYVQYLLGSNTTTSATPSSFTAPPSKL